MCDAAPRYTLRTKRVAPAADEEGSPPMCCLFTVLALLGPRAAVVIWWLMEPARWNLAFNGFLVPFLGFLFLPFTTLMYVIVFPGGVDGFDFVWLGLAVVLDVGTMLGGGYRNRQTLTGSY
jgi:hypothetical protein